MKKNKKQGEFLEQLKKVPIVQVAAEKTDISRNSVYRWRIEDPAFAAAMDEALKEGEDLVNDISESQLLTMIKNNEWQAISFWLRHRNPRFKDKVEITAKIDDTGVLTPEQEAIVRQALKLVGTMPLENKNQDIPHGNNTTNDSAGTGGNNAQ